MVVSCRFRSAPTPAAATAGAAALWTASAAAGRLGARGDAGGRGLGCRRRAVGRGQRERPLPTPAGRRTQPLSGFRSGQYPNFRQILKRDFLTFSGRKLIRLYKISSRKNITHSGTDWWAPKVHRFVLLRETELVLRFSCKC